LSQYEHEGAQLALRILREGSVRTPSLAEVENSDVVLILGADPTNEAPMLDFAIRQAMRRAPLDISRRLKIPDWDAVAVSNAVRNARGALYSITPWRIKLEDIGTEANHVTYADVARIADEIRDALTAEGLDGLVHRMAQALRNARQPLVVTSISAGTEVLRSAAQLAWALQNSGLVITVPEANTMGVSMIGGMSVDEAAQQIESGQADTLVVLENDLTRRMGRDRLDALLGKAKNVIVLDCIRSDRSDIILPTRAWVEDDGTLVNSEGRAQRFYQVFVPESDQRPAWQVLGGLKSATWTTYEDVLHDMAEHFPALADAVEAVPSGDWRSSAGQKIAREPHRFTGRTAMHADRTVFEPSTPPDPSTPFNFSMEGDQRPVPGPLVPRFWWPGWNSENSVTRFEQEVNGPLQGGNSGKRLIEPSGGRPDLGSVIYKTGAGDVWIVPTPHIFGSDELSMFSPGIADLAPEPYIAVSGRTAHRLGVSAGQAVGFEAGGATRRLPVMVDDSIAADTAVVVAGMNETLGITMPVKTTVRSI
jgi:NADH-quinone oxidoreductase subunit G